MSAYESTVFALSRTPFALSRQRLRPCAIRFRSYSVALTLSSTACTSLSNRRAFSQVHVRAAEIAVVEREPDLASGPGQFVWDENPPLLGARGRDRRARSGKIKCWYWS